MSDVTAQGLYPAEHRAFRELHAAARQLERHWGGLARRLSDDLLAEGAAAAHQLLSELRGRAAVQGRPTAQGIGAQLAGARGASDLLLERNQAFRAALLDLQHVTTLLGYAAALAHTRGDEELASWEQAWADRLRVLEDRGRAAAAALGADPERAIAPCDDGRAGRAGARLGTAVGTFGEALDHSPLGRLARRRST